MLKRGIASIVIWLAVLSSVCWASCDQFYPLGKVVTKQTAIELCNASYVVVFDPAVNGAIFSAEKYRPNVQVKRSNAFHSDPRVANGPKVANYLNSGYDKGHLTPAEDATTVTEEFDTFLITNMTPQAKLLNEASWRMLETTVRNLNPDYILTGAIYPAVPNYIKGTHVPIPASYYKLVWVHGSIYGWYADNLDTAKVVAIDIKEVESMSGLSFPRY